ncbi:MAG: hypothetical protein EPN79_02065 [Burkholderiaceae bacterium]|nr:MAG: hypothetical protein EPN79_02065 [Burkholderiaceae bacterium]
MPLPSGELLQRGLATGLPLLFSANAFAKVGADREFNGFRLDAARRIPDDVDASLDSAGFVAAVRYGGYRWEIDDYLELVAARAWSWWATMDYCVEEAVAGNTGVRTLRIDATLSNYFKCARRAAQRGLSAPMPVIQGWTASDYVACARNMPLQSWPALVGVGSVCRRQIGGRDGILSVIEAIDKVLPANCMLHLFGVKSGALKALQAFGKRIASVDSMAWDAAVRRAHPTGRTQALRARAMVNWHDKQIAGLTAAGLARQVQQSLLPMEQPTRTLEDTFSCAVGKVFGDLHCDGEIDYREARTLLEQDLTVVRLLLEQYGVSAFMQEEPQNDFGLGVTYSAVRDALIQEGFLREYMNKGEVLGRGAAIQYRC